MSEPAHFELGYRQTIQFYAKALDNADRAGGKATDQVMRDLGSTDLFFLLVFVLKRADLIHPWLFARCREVQRDPNGRIDLWPREHYKSTVITFGLTIFDIINDPDITIGIFSHTKPVAKKFLSQIKTEMEVNADLSRLWPGVFYANPKSEAPKWSEDGGLIVKRKSNPKEATLEAHGLVDGQPTGRHFKLRVYDDVVTMESVSTPDQIAKTTQAWQMSDNLGAIGGAVRYIGTRYHLFDTYRSIMDAKVAITRIYPATDDGTELGNPVFMSREVLAEKRKNQGPYIFASQMLINPTADKAMGFKREWLIHADVDRNAAMKQLWRAIIVDPAGSKQRQGNDYTTMWVLGNGEDNKLRVLDMLRDRLNLIQRAEMLMGLHRLWTPGLVAYEEYGMQADIEHIKYVQKQEMYEFDIVALGGQMPKPLRILRLVPWFESGRIILPTRLNRVDYQGHNRDLVQDFVEQEYTAFPVLKHDDMLDSLARLVDLEAMSMIEKPKKTLPEQRGNTGFRNLEGGNNSTGSNDDWLTA